MSMQMARKPRQSTKQHVSTSVVQKSKGRSIKAFVVMPFLKKYDKIFHAIKSAGSEAGVEVLRGDEMRSPGPIINQIFDVIAEADCIVAEVGSMNPNVYYEIGLAHCVERPSILIANKNKIEDIPFDIRHNRVIPYDEKNIEELAEKLRDSLNYLKEAVINNNVAPTLEDHLESISGGSQDSGIVLRDLIAEVGSDYKLTNPRLDEQTALDNGGFSIRIVDDFFEKVVFTVDVNGNIKRKKRVP